MIGNSKNFIDVAYNTATELKKENVTNNNSFFQYKFQKFTVPKIQIDEEYLYSLNLECEQDSILNIDLKAIFNNNILIKISVNNVLVYDTNDNDIDINIDIIVKNINNIDINIISEDSVEMSDFVLKIKGNFKNVINKTKFIFKTNSEKICVAKQVNNKICYTEYLDVETLKNNFYYDVEECAFELLQDFTYTVINQTKSQSNIYLYKHQDLSLRLSNLTSEILITNSNVDCACVLPINKEDCVFEVVYVKDNIVTIALIDNNLNIQSTKTLPQSIGEKIVEVGGVDNYTYLNLNVLYFVTNNNNVYITFAVGNQSNLTFGDVYKVCKGERCLMFSNQNFLYLFSYFNNCLEVHKFNVENINSITSASKISKHKFYNCDNGFLYNGEVYIISGKNITKVDINE